jgi:hypothetical protein
LTPEEQNSAIDELLATKTPREIALLLEARDNRRLHAEEDVKTHPLTEFEMTDEQWGRFVTHMLDGGGVRQDELMLGDGPSLRDQFHTALLSHDRKKTLHLLPHLVKSLMVRTGMRRRLPGGGVASGPHGGPPQSMGMSLAAPIPLEEKK